MKTRALLLAAIFLTASPHPGCSVAPAAAHAPPQGGVYELVNGQDQPVYVGQSGNLPHRLARWKAAHPDLGGKVMIRSGDIRVRLGVEQVLYTEALRASRANGYTLMNRQAPLDIQSPATLPEHEDYVRLGKDYLDRYGVLGFDTLNYGPAAVEEAPLWAPGDLDHWRMTLPWTCTSGSWN